MPRSSRRGSPRASRSMVDLLSLIGSCGDVVRYWELTEQAYGAVLRVRSRQLFVSEQEAAEAAAKLLQRVVPVGYDVRATTVGARHDDISSNPGWRASVELVLGFVQDQPVTVPQ